MRSNSSRASAPFLLTTLLLSSGLWLVACGSTDGDAPDEGANAAAGNGASAAGSGASGQAGHGPAGGASGKGGSGGSPAKGGNGGSSGSQAAAGQAGKGGGGSGGKGGQAGGGQGGAGASGKAGQGGAGQGGAGQGGAGQAGSEQGGAGQAGAGGGGECQVAGDCPGVDTSCLVRSCEAGKCGMSPVPSGTKLALQKPGDCLVDQCDGKGQVAQVADDADTPDDANPCTQDLCAAGVASHEPVSAGAPCGPSLQCDGAGLCVGCVSPSDCPGQDSECQARTCDQGACGVAFAAAGTPVASQKAGDCLRNVCDGKGQTVSQADDADVPGDNNGCTVDACSGGVPSISPSPAGSPCTDGGGKVCDGAKACVECVAGAGCSSGVCQAGSCQAASCSDGVKNGIETDTDCGGSCPACGDGHPCSVGNDCQSGVCTANVCQAAACNDGVKNGKETGVDCGGSCSPCDNGQGCGLGADCKSGVCSASLCQAASCLDGTKNGAETDTDCGGGDCAPCADQKACAAGQDCASLVCSSSVCQAASCSDGVKNGSETDADCGGSCPICAVGQGCKAGADCASGVCSAGVCQGPSCSDGVKNGAETDVDCGPGCSLCATGKGCVVGASCQSGVCSASVCQAPACNDGIKNGAETDADCGGSCSGCSAGKACAAAADCQSGVCSGNACQSPACNDGVKNGGESDVDCGGSCGACTSGHACQAASDCVDNVCTAGKCQSASCNDGVKNGAETDADCGASCPACSTGKVCAAANDCQSLKCSGGVCQASSCSDSIKNGSETGVDCGGSCTPCPPGDLCSVASDCLTGVCKSGVCQSALCTDGVKNGTESDVDCGGNQCAKCSKGSACSSGSDCTSGVCSGGVCAAYVLGVYPGTYHTCATHGNGLIKCWGRNNLGQLGQGNTTYLGDNAGEMGSSLAYVDLGTGRTVKTASVSLSATTCAVLDNGSLKCWGQNDYGQLGQGDTNARGDNAGEMGDNLPAIDLGAGRTAKQVSVGDSFACALLDDGTVKCWGRNQYGQLGQGDTVARGDNAGEMGDNLPAVKLGTGRTAVAISCGNVFACALLDNGALKCWGNNGYGQLGLGDTTSRGTSSSQMGDALPSVSLGTGRTAVSIQLAANHTCALLNDGTVKCWGYNLDGRLGLGDLVTRGDNAGEMGDSLPTIALGTGRTAKSLSVGANHACALLDDSTVKCWGWNSNGQLGQGDNKLRGASPADMGDNLPAISFGTGHKPLSVFSGSFHNCALLDDDSLKCWGYNSSGQLGLGDTNARGDNAGEMGDSLPSVSF